MPDPATPDALTNALSAISAIGTAVAAGFAAWSAWIARSATKIAQDGVNEAKAARMQQTAPRLVLERDFLDFQFVYPHQETPTGEAAFLARKDSKDTAPSPPTFTLTNCGGGPAIELQIVFEFEDPNDAFTLPEQFAQYGLKMSTHLSGNISEIRPLLQFQLSPGRGSVGLPLYRKWTTDIPHCAPGQSRSVAFPPLLLSTLFLRGLQYWERRGDKNAIQDIVLTVRISCHTVEGEPYTTQFRFSASPFWQGQSNPLIVCGHFRELPMHEKPDEPRVG